MEHEQEHEVYGGEIPEEGDMDADIDMSRVDDEDENASKELEDMKKRLKGIEEEAGALREMQAKVEKEMGAVQVMDTSEELDCSASNIYKDPDDGRQRFLLELEFVQCLANPTYIHYLAQNRYFEDEAFIGYLKYLQYWQRPEYIKFIMYPHCLFFLEQLQNENFRNAMAHPANKELAHRQQFYFWKNYRNNRLKHILPRPLPEPVATPQAAAPPPAPAASASTIASSNPIPTSASGPIPSPMQYAIPAGSSLAKNDPRNSAVDRRKRKKDG